MLRFTDNSNTVLTHNNVGNISANTSTLKTYKRKHTENNSKNTLTPPNKNGNSVFTARVSRSSDPKLVASSVIKALGEGGGKAEVTAVGTAVGKLALSLGRAAEYASVKGGRLRVKAEVVYEPLPVQGAGGSVNAAPASGDPAARGAGV